MERVYAVTEPGLLDPPDRSSGDAEVTVLTVVSAVITQLRDGRVRIDGTADQLGLSVRSLQRRLTSHGLTYRELVDSVRRNRALLLLEHSSLTVTEIAMELGYSEHANFTRAFRRWIGRAPQLYRQKVVPLARAGRHLSTSRVPTEPRAPT